MTKDEYELSFSEWCNIKKHCSIAVNEYGDYLVTDENIQKYKEAQGLHYDDWIAQRNDYRLNEKNFNIYNTIVTCKARGIKAYLANWQNACVKVIDQKGRKYTYYATTGTIAGYGETNTKGLDALIRLCES